MLNHLQPKNSVNHVQCRYFSLFRGLCAIKRRALRDVTVFVKGKLLFARHIITEM
jgi:hypothetical protein